MAGNTDAVDFRDMVGVKWSISWVLLSMIVRIRRAKNAYGKSWRYKYLL